MRLKKKPKPGEEKPDQPIEAKKPAAEDKKTEEPPAKDPVPTEAQENEKEVFDRVAKNMRSLEERLANKELGDATRQTGEDIAKDLDSLIHAMESPPPDGGASGEESQNDASSSPSGGKSPDGQKNQGNQKKQGKQGSQKNRNGTQQQPGSQRNGGNGSDTMPGGGAHRQPEKRPGQTPMGGEGEKNNDPSGTSNKNRTSGNDKDSELNNNADLYKDIWGHLPEALRAEMNAYSTDKEMIPKYDALIKKCSRTIAEQSSRKDK
jgi:hypothetical protein